MLSTQNILYKKKYSSRHWFNPLSSSNLVFVKEIYNSDIKWVCLSSQMSQSEPVPQSLTASGPNPNAAHQSTRGQGFCAASHWPYWIIIPAGHSSTSSPGWASPTAARRVLWELCLSLGHTPTELSSSPSEPQLSCSSGSSTDLKPTGISKKQGIDDKDYYQFSIFPIAPCSHNVKAWQSEGSWLLLV